MLHDSNLDDLDPSAWIPLANRHHSENELRIRLITEKTGNKLYISTGNKILQHLKINLSSQDKILICTHPDDVNYFLMMKSSNGYTIQKNAANSIKVAWHHPVIKKFKIKSVPYSLHPNHTITFRLKNDGE